MSLMLDALKKDKEVELDILEFNKLKNTVQDEDFLSFIKKYNGGCFLNNSLRIYGILPVETELELNYNTYLFKKYYNSLIDVALVFAEDIFGNQFCFLNDGSLAFINIETGEATGTFTNFNDFLYKIETDIDYYSGCSLAKQWVEKFGNIGQFERLAPIKPFIIGGEYSITNLYKLDKEKLFDYFSCIANQIKNLPDGSPIEIKVV